MTVYQLLMSTIEDVSQAGLALELVWNILNWIYRRYTVLFDYLYMFILIETNVYFGLKYFFKKQSKSYRIYQKLESI